MTKQMTKKTVSLTEAYSNRLRVAEGVYKKEHNGQALDENKKLIVAKVLNNTNKFLTENFEAAQGTQLAAMGNYKKFCLDITTVALPNCIAFDLVLVSPMKTHTGYVQYLRLVASTEKGGVNGDLIADPFKLGKMTDSRINYTSNSVVEPFTGDGTTTEFELGFTQGAQIAKITVAGTETDAYTFADGTVTFTTAPADGAAIRIAYTYDNTVIPQEIIPTISAEMDGIELKAKARRIAIYYSMLAQYTLKVETGEDLGKFLEAAAVNEIQYEIDTEVIKLLNDKAVENTTPEELAEVTFNKRLPLGVGIKDHYYGLLEKLDNGSAIIYNRTQKYEANFMVCARNVIPVLSVIDAFKASGDKKVGPYYAGNINGLKVYVSPYLKPSTFFLGFNGNALEASPAVFAPFMAIAPTQLVGLPDGSMQQGFATMYDLKALPGNATLLLVAGKIVDEAYPIEVTGAGE